MNTDPTRNPRLWLVRRMVLGCLALSGPHLTGQGRLGLHIAHHGAQRCATDGRERDMTDTEYNGWTNRETWAVMLHVNNDEGLQTEALDMARDFARYDNRTNDLADAFNSWIEDLLSPAYWRDNFGAPMPEGIEMMRSEVGSLWRVNWRECAESLLSDIAESGE